MGGKGGGKGRSGGEKTVFIAPGEPLPAPADTTPMGPDEDPAPPPERGKIPEPTEWAPSPVPAAPTPPAGAEAPGGTGMSLPPAGAAPRAPGQGIKPGDILNHIFEVKRFIARGGMGEVFEGCNVNSDERVAIKVMLPSLAADENVISMFRREAKTLTRLQHEALVQYRLLAHEPQLGVLYIVTEYVDGVNLSEALGTLPASPEDLLTLLRRLASGLRAAHSLGAIHRDMAPDNVLLDGGRLSSAKIIDFGIAKDLDPGTATIIGDGFAGKLNYVAPEQLGIFGREVGPWTDVYSLALVILAVAGRRDVNLGGTLVDAVDKRRAGVDMSAAPDLIRPVLEQMLKPDPAERLRSMDEVLRLLDAPATIPPPPPVPKSPQAPKSGNRVPLLVGGALAGGLALVAAFLWFNGGTTPGSPAAAPQPKAATVAGPAPISLEGARAAVERALPGIGCSWLDITDFARDGDRVRVRMAGVAGSPAIALKTVSDALAGAGLSGADVDSSEVTATDPQACTALDTYRQVRSELGPRLTLPQRQFEMEPVEGDEARRASKPIFNLSMANPSQDFALFSLEPGGVVNQVVGSRAVLVAAAANPKAVVLLGGDRYRLTTEVDYLGWSGLLLISGKGPFEPDLTAPPVNKRDQAWRDAFLRTARERGWKTEMVWFKSVDDRPG